LRSLPPNAVEREELKERAVDALFFAKNKYQRPLKASEALNDKYQALLSSKNPVPARDWLALADKFDKQALALYQARPDESNNLSFTAAEGRRRALRDDPSRY